MSFFTQIALDILIVCSGTSDSWHWKATEAVAATSDSAAAAPSEGPAPAAAKAPRAHGSKPQRKRVAKLRPALGGPIPPQLLTAILRDAKTVPQLTRHVYRYGPQFNHRHVGCCLNRLAKAMDATEPGRGGGLTEGAQELLLSLDRMLAERAAACTARELCNALWVWAKLGHVPEPATWAAVRRALFGEEARSEGAEAEGREGAADADAGAETGPARSQPIGPACCDFAGGSPGFQADGVDGRAGLRSGDDRPPAPVGLPSAVPSLSGATPQGLSNAAWALARLGCTDRFAWLRIAEHSLRMLPSYSPYDISNTAYAFAAARQQKAHPTHVALMEALAAAAVAQIGSFCPQDLSNMLWAYARGGMPQPALFAAASPAVRRTLPGFSHAGMVQVLWAYATLRVRDAALLGDLARAMLPQLPRLDARNLALLTWALARLVVSGSVAASAAAAAATAGADDGGAAGTGGRLSDMPLGNYPFSLALAARVRAGFKDPLAKYYEQGGSATAAAAAAAAATATVEAFGTSSPSPPPSGDEEARLGEATEGDRTAAFAWSARAAVLPEVELDLPSDSEFEAGAAALLVEAHADAAAEAAVAPSGAVGAADAYDASTYPTGMAAAAASMAQPQVNAAAAASAAAEAVLAHAPPQLLSSITSSALSRLDSLDTRHLTVLIWSMTSLGNADPALFATAAAVLTRRLRSPRGVSPPCLSHIAWSYAVVGHYDADLYDALAAAARQAAGGWRPSDVSLAVANVLWALGRAGHYDPQVFASASRVVLAAALDGVASGAGAGGVNQLALVMLACAFVGHDDPELYAGVAAAVRGAGAASMRDSSLANICWSMAVLDHRDLGLLAELFRDVAERRAEVIGARGCTQLFHCCLWLQDLVPGGSELVDLLPPRVLQVGRAAFLQLAKDPSISDFQSQVFRALESLGLRPAMELKTPDRLFSLDSVIQLGGVSLAVESNGPQHYLRTHPKAFSGSSRLRHALLRHRGFHLTHINWRQWEALGGDTARQRLFLRGLLAEAAERLALQVPRELLTPTAEEQEAEEWARGAPGAAAQRMAAAERARAMGTAGGEAGRVPVRPPAASTEPERGNPVAAGVLADGGGMESEATSDERGRGHQALQEREQAGFGEAPRSQSRGAGQVAGSQHGSRELRPRPPPLAVGPMPKQLMTVRAEAGRAEARVERLGEGRNA
ncbi:hypothetical protein GPECTOR_36g74 [Gonium pectorale]|uniref:RAP domain-containing protein n=1 Tax=Gonium pectorale TaxID=33097 RepID=A0A150GBW9_GONPE|nr:hypothetical protein GPECTOR_36g74 [Gonium pectorale]|eukprot:KXZ47351.1 hypothetical protein GPECTOR_36g74 [Gonium pectorale]